MELIFNGKYLSSMSRKELIAVVEFFMLQKEEPQFVKLIRDCSHEWNASTTTATGYKCIKCGADWNKIRKIVRG